MFVIKKYNKSGVEGIKDVTYMLGKPRFAAYADMQKESESYIGLYPTQDMAIVERGRAMRGLQYYKGVNSNDTLSQDGITDLGTADSARGRFRVEIESQGTTIVIGYYPTLESAIQIQHAAIQEQQEQQLKHKNLLFEDRLKNGDLIETSSKELRIPNVQRKNYKSYKAKKSYITKIYVQLNGQRIYVASYKPILQSAKKQSAGGKKARNRKTEKKSKTGHQGIIKISPASASRNKLLPTYEVRYRDSKIKKECYLGRFATLDAAVDSKYKFEIGEYVKPEKVPNNKAFATKYSEITNVSYQYPEKPGEFFYVRLKYQNHVYSIGVYSDLEEGYRRQQEVRRYFDTELKRK